MTRNFKIILAIVIGGLISLKGILFLQKELEDYLLAQIVEPFKKMPLIQIKIPEKLKKPPLEIEAKAVFSLKTNLNNLNKILFEKEAEKPLPIASLTKLMTALVVLEENYDLKSLVTISPAAASQENSPFGGLKSGEKLTVEKLLELMLIYSSNDAAFALSEVIGTENFVEKMNQKAESLGLENTHFVNPTGLEIRNLDFNEENLNHFNRSSAKDLAKLAQYILKEQPKIFEISIQTPEYRLEDGILTLFLTKEIVGGKTGYTPQAGGCILFIFSDQQEPKNFFINIILGSPSTSSRIKEMQKLIDWIES